MTKKKMIHVTVFFDNDEYTFTLDVPFWMDSDEAISEAQEAVLHWSSKNGFVYDEIAWDYELENF